MAKDASFDIVSEFDKQELVNAIDQVKRELTTRFDLKDSNSNIEIIEDKAINMLFSVWSYSNVARIIPGIETDICGVALVLIVLFLQRMRAKKLQNMDHTELV